MSPDELDLDPRLTALEGRVEADLPTPALPAHGRRTPRLAVSLATAGVLVLALGATALAGAAATGLIAFGAPGVENPGEPLEGAGLECMSPPEAAAYLAGHGYRDVVWQIETTTKDPTGVASPAAPVQVSTPPEHGYVIPGSIIRGQLHMIVDQRANATGVGACSGIPMP